MAATLFGTDLPQKEEAFKWFDSLKLPGLEKGEFVQLQIYSENGSKAGKPVFGFVTATEPESTPILTSALESRRFFKKQDYKRRMERTPADLRKYAVERMEIASKLRASREKYPRSEYAEVPPVELFVLSRILTIRGDKPLADKLYDMAFSLTPEVTEATLKTEVEAALLQRVLEAFINREISRAELAKMMQTFIGQFPNNPRAGWLKEQIPIYTQMAEEERKHVSRPLKSLKTEEQVAELIYRFRDTGGGFGPAEKFPDEPSPIIALGKIGYAAVPQLIEALSDTRPTRESKPIFWRDRPPGLISIGSRAAMALREISCRDFGSPPNLQKIEEWWKVAKGKGEQQALSEDVASGAEFPYDPGWRLVEKYPKVAVKPLLAGIGNAKEESAKRRMIQRLGELRTPESTEALREVLRRDGDIEIVLTTATWLMNVDTDFAVAALLKIQPKLSLPGGKYTHEGSRWERGMRLLVQSQRPEAIEPFMGGLKAESIRHRTAFIRAATTATKPTKTQPATEQQRDEFLKRLEGILALELQNELWLPTQDNWIAGHEVAHTRPCDLAAAAMATLWPERYEWTGFAAPLDREIARLQVLNRWRESQGEKPLPLPLRLTRAQLSEAEAAPLLAKFRAAKTPEERKATLEAIEARGWPAIALLQKEFPNDAEVANIARRYANTVREVKILGEVAPEKAEQLRALLPKAGTVLTARTLITLQSEATKLMALPREILVSAVRDKDGFGTTVTIDLQIGSQMLPGEDTGQIRSVSVDGKRQYYKRGNIMNRAMIPDPGPTFGEVAEKALASDAWAVVEIYYSGSRWERF